MNCPEFSYKTSDVSVVKKDWLEIYNLAAQEGNKAANKCPRRPVKCSDGTVQHDGIRGFADIVVSDGRSAFARWLKAQNIGHKISYGGWAIPADPVPDGDVWWGIQSFDPKDAYAREFVKVLRNFGVDCYADSRYD